MLFRAKVRAEAIYHERATCTLAGDVKGCEYRAHTFCQQMAGLAAQDHGVRAHPKGRTPALVREQ